MYKILNTIRVEKVYEVSYFKKDVEKTEYVDDVKVADNNSLLIKKGLVWGLITDDGIVIEPMHKYFLVVEIPEIYTKLLFTELKELKGVYSIKGKFLCDFKYKDILSKYYGASRSFVVENKNLKRGVVKDAVEIIPLKYDSIEFNYVEKLWKCRHIGEDYGIDYYNVYGKPLK